MKKYDDDVIDDARACFVDKKNPDKCLDKVIKEYDLEESDKVKILTKIAKEELE